MEAVSFYLVAYTLTIIKGSGAFSVDAALAKPEYSSR